MLANKYQKILFVASSIGNVVAQEINKDRREIFNQSSTLNAQIVFLNSYLEAREMECTISSALAMVLMHRNFTWSNKVTPSGLSASIISSRDIINNETLWKRIVLDYSIIHEILNSFTNAKRIWYCYEGDTHLMKHSSLVNYFTQWMTE